MFSKAIIIGALCGLSQVDALINRGNQTAAVEMKRKSGNDICNVNSAAGQCQPLQRCSKTDASGKMIKPSGFQRTGYCETIPSDHGTHVVCAEVTDQFLQFTKSEGNDLITPVPAYQFPGLVAGDRWCLCAIRWRDALNHGAAPNVVLDATQDVALEFVGKTDLTSHAAR